MKYPYNTWESLGKKICAIDLDDTLADSIPFWLDFLNKKLGTHFSDITNAKDIVSYNKYRELKYEYRSSGVKLEIPTISGAAEITAKLRDLGFQIYIITARPIGMIPALGKITYEWLENNNISYDSVFFNKNKHIEIILRVPNLRFYINDHRTESNLVALWGYPCFLIENQYNKGHIESEVIRIKNLEEIFHYTDIISNDKKDTKLLKRIRRMK